MLSLCLCVYLSAFVMFTDIWCIFCSISALISVLLNLGRLNSNNFNAKSRRGKLPFWVTKMVNVFIGKFADEYDVRNEDAYRYFFHNEKSLERLKQLFCENGVPVESYTMEELPSHGLLFPEKHDLVVEYILKYGTEKEET